MFGRVLGFLEKYIYQSLSLDFRGKTSSVVQYFLEMQFVFFFLNVFFFLDFLGFLLFYQSISFD